MIGVIGMIIGVVEVDGKKYFPFKMNRIERLILTSNDVVMDKVKMPSFFELYDNFCDNEVSYSTNGMSTILISKMTLKEFILKEIKEDNQKYVFHDLYIDSYMFNIISNLIPLPKVNLKMRISRLYVGSKGSGTHIHKHSVAINYLVDGKKLWFCFPNTDHNNRKLSEIKSHYGQIRDMTTVKWYETYSDFLKENMEGYQEFFQETGQFIIVPHHYHHGVINLSSVIGITYSWY